MQKFSWEPWRPLRRSNSNKHGNDDNYLITTSSWYMVYVHQILINATLGRCDFHPWPFETQLQSQSLPHLHPQMDRWANLRNAAASDGTADVGMSSPWTAPRQKVSKYHGSSTADLPSWQLLESRSKAKWRAEPLISRLPWHHDGLPAWATCQWCWRLGHPNLSNPFKDIMRSCKVDGKQM